jgi:hypothetical protein
MLGSLSEKEEQVIKKFKQELLHRYPDKVRRIDYRLSIQVMSEAKIEYMREKNFQFAQNIFRDAVSA